MARVMDGVREATAAILGIEGRGPVPRHHRAGWPGPGLRGPDGGVCIDREAAVTWAPLSTGHAGHLAPIPAPRGASATMPGHDPRPVEAFEEDFDRTPAPQRTPAGRGTLALLLALAAFAVLVLVVITMRSE